ncbi:fucose 4-O-acetylase-like acetyltransferase [Pseudomonas duriflava]|uniref:Fucose 4-O-acetylase-like acetyltransferase n=1 Tax=Pseudomonas duriflava TaxID=459528 RepID=A0A562QIK9_9PSED|nr:acyltransferase [Pseudomonas duriflava]TWI56587.1 fucose 4-O-acetylase-like acetyltransferase [Pseudomonas duriflava]
MRNTKPEKDLRIETIRGLALFLMVAGHVIGSSGDQGMKVSDDSFLRYLYDSLVYIRMPLFTAISGYVYALRPVTESSILMRFYQGKFKRILIPMIVVSTLFFVMQSLVPNTNTKPQWSDIFSIYFFSYAHFWFLQSIFCIFLVVAVIEKIGLLSSIRNYLVIMAIGIVASLNYESFPEFFCFYKAVQLFPFFLLGLGLYRYSDQLVTIKKQVTIALCLLVLVVIDQAYLFDQIDFSDSEMSLIGTALGLTAIYMIITKRIYFKPLAWLGYFSFEIYLFHVFGTAGSRIVLNKLSIHDPWIMFTVSMVLGLLLPVMLKKAVERINILNLAFFGTPAKRKHEIKLQEKVSLG